MKKRKSPLVTSVSAQFLTSISTSRYFVPLVSGSPNSTRFPQHAHIRKPTRRLVTPGRY